MTQKKEPRISAFMTAMLTISWIMAVLYALACFFFTSSIQNLTAGTELSARSQLFLGALSIHIYLLPIFILPLLAFLKKHLRTQVLFLGLQFLLMIGIGLFIRWGAAQLQTDALKSLINTMNSLKELGVETYE